MKEILFRGNRVDGYGWVYGYLVHDEAERNQPRIIIGREYSTGTYFHCQAPRVLRATVGQFTGLLDANGEKIFEGDILKERNGEDIGFIRYADEDGMFYLVADNVLYDFSNCNSKWYEVIGNIHDNPELVEVAR